MGGLNIFVMVVDDRPTCTVWWWQTGAIANTALPHHSEFLGNLKGNGGLVFRWPQCSACRSITPLAAAALPSIDPYQSLVPFCHWSSHERCKIKQVWLWIAGSVMWPQLRLPITIICCLSLLCHLAGISLPWGQWESASWEVALLCLCSLSAGCHQLPTIRASYNWLLAVYCGTRLRPKLWSVCVNLQKATHIADR